MKPGDVLNCSLWYNSEKPTERHDASHGVITTIEDTAKANGFRVGPVTLTEIPAGDPRVPEPPAHFQGKPTVLYGEAEIVGEIIRPEPFRLSMDLEKKDLIALRKATRREFAKAFPKVKPLTDEECDRVIDECGPAAAEKTVRQGTHFDA